MYYQLCVILLAVCNVHFNQPFLIASVIVKSTHILNHCVRRFRGFEPEGWLFSPALSPPVSIYVITFLKASKCLKIILLLSKLAPIPEL